MLGMPLLADYERTQRVNPRWMHGGPKKILNFCIANQGQMPSKPNVHFWGVLWCKFVSPGSDMSIKCIQTVETI